LAPVAEEEKEVTKVFFVEPFVGKRIVHHYKKIKPATVILSPGRKSKTTKKYTSFPVEDTAGPTLTSSFKIVNSLHQEKFWRALLFTEYRVCREVFFGIGPTSIRIINPETNDADLVVTLLCVAELKFYTYLGNPTLLFKYFTDPSNVSKSKKLRFHVLPVTGQEMIRWYEHCTNLGDIPDSITSLKTEVVECPQKPFINLPSDDKENSIPISDSDKNSVIPNKLTAQSQPTSNALQPSNKCKKEKVSTTNDQSQNRPPKILKSKSARQFPIRV